MKDNYLEKDAVSFLEENKLRYYFDDKNLYIGNNEKYASTGLPLPKTNHLDRIIIPMTACLEIATVNIITKAKG